MRPAQGTAAQRPAPTSQSGRAELQSAFDWHCTHACVTGSHRGVVPEQSVSPRQVPQKWSRQKGPAAEPPQPTPSSHWVQNPSSHFGAEAGQAVVDPTVQAITQRRLRQRPPAPQS